MRQYFFSLHKPCSGRVTSPPCQRFYFSPANCTRRRVLGLLLITCTLFFLFLIYGCQTTRVSQKSVKTRAEITDQLSLNKKVKETNDLPSYRKALNQTEAKLKSVLADLLQSESIRVKQEEKIIELKDKLSTWTSIKVTFWIIVSIAGLLGGFAMIKKIKPSLL